jgi:hypothetical protein
MAPDAVEEAVFWQGVSDDYARLHADPERRSDYVSELAEWDRTVGDVWMSSIRRAAAPVSEASGFAGDGYHDMVIRLLDYFRLGRLKAASYGRQQRTDGRHTRNSSAHSYSSATAELLSSAELKPVLQRRAHDHSGQSSRSSATWLSPYALVSPELVSRSQHGGLPRRHCCYWGTPVTSYR